MGRPSKIEKLEAQQGRPIVEILQEAFDKHSTQSAVAASLGIGQATVSTWLTRLGLTTKTRTVLVSTAEQRTKKQTAPTPSKSNGAA